MERRIINYFRCFFLHPAGKPHTHFANGIYFLPTCGRTSFDIQPLLAIIKEKTKHLKGLKIAVMGCVVNGPGEMADADYGLVGNTNGNINLYQGKNIIQKNISPEAAPMHCCN